MSNTITIKKPKPRKPYKTAPGGRHTPKPRKLHRKRKHKRKDEE